MKTFESKRCPGGLWSILVFTVGLASLGSATEGIWTKKADMPSARMLLDTCVLDGKIYAIGGAPAPHMGISAVEQYDPGTDIWTRKAPMPTPRAGLGVSAVNGKIYAIGGGGRTVEVYDPETDTWTRKADMPTARSFLSTSVVNGMIYAIGGAMDTGGPGFRAVEAYDTKTDTWTRKADMPEPRYLHTAGVVAGKIYIIAGSWQAWTASPSVFAYDPATDTWERKADAPTARSWQSPTAGVADGRIYVIGGDAGPPDADVEEYDPVTDTWRTRADMPTPRGALSTASLNNRIYVMGGTVTLFNDVLSTVEEYTPNPLVVDFNGDGIVDIKDLLRLIESWGQAGPQVDIGPSPFGDGIVEANDLEVLMQFWGQEVDDPTLKACWKLDETEGDIAYDSAAENDAMVLGDAFWLPDDGHVNGAIQLDGINDYVSTPFVLNPVNGHFSVMAWIEGGAPGQVILSQKDGVNWLMADSAGGVLRTDLRTPEVGGGRATRQPAGPPLISSTVISDGDWHRIGVVWTGSERILYVDAIEVARDPNESLESALGGLYIGCGSDFGTDSFYAGLIDDVRIYNRIIEP